MEWVETTGRTVEEALDAALDELGVHEEDVEFEVLAEPRAGLLGRFRGSEARIRVRIKPVSREKPGDRRRRKGGRTREADEGRTRLQEEPSGRARRARREGERSGRRGRARESEMEHVTTVPVEDQAREAVAFTAGLVEALGFDAEVEDEVEDDTIILRIEGEDLGLLVGPKGATLGALEELVRAVVQRQSGGHGARVRLDVAGYRAKRRAALEAFTRQLVEQVLESGEEQALEPMGAPDRKVVHDVVNEIPGVETTSEGEEPRRHVVIRLA